MEWGRWNSKSSPVLDFSPNELHHAPQGDYYGDRKHNLLSLWKWTLWTTVVSGIALHKKERTINGDRTHTGITSESMVREDSPWKGCVTMVAQERAIISLVVWHETHKDRQEVREEVKLAREILFIVSTYSLTVDESSSGSVTSSWHHWPASIQAPTPADVPHWQHAVGSLLPVSVHCP